MNPRLHLFDFARELRGFIYNNVFAVDGGQNSEFLRPLLTSRQFYHEADASAWTNATFVLNRQSSMTSILILNPRKVHRVDIRVKDIPFLSTLSKFLPSTDILRITDGFVMNLETVEEANTQVYWTASSIYKAMATRVKRCEIAPATFAEVSRR